MEEGKRKEEGEDEEAPSPLSAVAVHLATGQRLTCRALVAGEEVVAGAPPRAGDLALLAPSAPAAAPTAISRAIIILDGPLMPLAGEAGGAGGAGAPAGAPAPSERWRLPNRLKERLGYLGVFYKRDPSRFLRHLAGAGHVADELCVH